MKNKVDVIVQARQGSTRLQNKILLSLDSKNNCSLDYIYERISKSKFVNKIIFAIPKKNYELLNYLKKKKYNYYIGSEKNVLDRYYKTSLFFKSKYICRITADCPLACPKLLSDLVKFFFKNKFNYVSNNNPPTLPDGFDLEIFKFSTLKKAWSNSKNLFEKEHVTIFMKNNEKNSSNLNYNTNSNYRFTLDDNKDLLFIKKFLKMNMKIKNFSYNEIINYYQKNKSKFKFKPSARDYGSKISYNNKLWDSALKVIPGGNSILSKRPDRFIKEDWPTYFSKAKGCYIWDINNTKYLDMSYMGVGTNVLGYSHPKINKAVNKAIDNGNLSTLNSVEEIQLAKKLVSIHDWADMCKFTRSGGEANALAVRIARAYTRKDGICVCGYHGWHDWYIASNHKKINNLDKHLLKNISPIGVPKDYAKHIYTFNYNDSDYLEKILIKNQNIGIIKMEVIRNIPPKPNFLKRVKILAKKFNCVLIFDECTTGFRENYGGIHLKYNINPDIAIFGKTLGNGFAINAILGKSKIMNTAKRTFISSTFWSERIGFTAALKFLDIVKEEDYKDIIKKGQYVKGRWDKLFKKYKIKVDIGGIDSLPFFKLKKNHLIFKTFLTKEMLKNKILSSDIIYISTSHSFSLLDSYLKYFEKIIIEFLKIQDPKIFKELKKISPNQGFGRLN